MQLAVKFYSIFYSIVKILVCVNLYCIIIAVILSVNIQYVVITCTITSLCICKVACQQLEHLQNAGVQHYR